MQHTPHRLSRLSQPARHKGAGSTAHRTPHVNRTGVARRTRSGAQDTPRHSAICTRQTRSPSCRDPQSTVAPCNSTHATRAPSSNFTEHRAQKNLHAGPPVGGTHGTRNPQQDGATPPACQLSHTWRVRAIWMARGRAAPVCSRKVAPEARTRGSTATSVAGGTRRGAGHAV